MPGTGLGIAISLTLQSGSINAASPPMINNFIQQDGNNFIQQNGTSVFLEN